MQTWSVDQLVPGGLLTRTDNSGPFTLTEARVVDLERDTTLIQIADPVVIGFAPGNFELPPDPDFHFTGAGYAELARLIYPGMRTAGLVP